MWVCHCLAVREAEIRDAVACMTMLNRGAAEAMVLAGASAATDVTGFGLLGHLRNMLRASGVDTVPARSVLEEGQQRARNPRRIRAEVTLSALNAIVTHLGALRERRSSVIFVSLGSNVQTPSRAQSSAPAAIAGFAACCNLVSEP